MTRPWSGPDLVSLGLLVAMAREGSIARAAAQFSMSQPSASTRLRALERALGLELLDRRASGAVPTDAGRLVIGWATEVGAALERLAAGAEALRASRHQSLRVAASFTIAEHLLPGWLASLRGRYEGVSVQLEVVNSEVVEERVAAGDADLGFVEGPGVRKGLVSRRIATDELVLVVAPSHPWATRRRPVPVGLLTSTPLVVRERGSGTRAALDRALRRAGLRAMTAVELGSTAAVLRAVEQGVGPTVISRLAVARELDDGRLVMVAVSGLDLSRSLRAVWRRGSVPGSLASALLDIASSSSDANGSTSAGPDGR